MTLWLLICILTVGGFCLCLAKDQQKNVHQWNWFENSLRTMETLEIEINIREQIGKRILFITSYDDSYIICLYSCWITAIYRKFNEKLF